MSNRTWLTIIIVLGIVIVVLTWLLFATPAEAPVVLTPATTTPSQSSEPPVLHDRVVISSPKSNSKVGKDFDVEGVAPGQWFFEALFPIQVRDKDGNVVGRTHANALGEWMTEGQVKFQASVHVDSYSGPATLILLKDNPSGLPENDDSIEVPIVIQ